MSTYEQSAVWAAGELVCRPDSVIRGQVTCGLVQTRPLTWENASREFSAFPGRSRVLAELWRNWAAGEGCDDLGSDPLGVNESHRGQLRSSSQVEQRCWSFKVDTRRVGCCTLLLHCLALKRQAP